MNFKSTLYLAFALAILAVGYLWVRSAGPADGTATAPQPSFGRSPHEQDLIATEAQPLDLVKVAARRKGGDEWVFEKRQADSGDVGARDEKRWYMTAPMEMAVTSFDVDGIGRQIRNIRYEVSYSTSDPGALTLADAGLDPPETVVTMSDADGKSVTLEIGRAASERKRYVRLAGADEFCVATSSLDNLFKETALDYREKQLWKFAAEDVTRIEIVDRTDPDQALRYAFANTNGRWMIESPVTGRATSKLDGVVRSLSSLRAVGWHDRRPERLAAYGLQPATWTIITTVEESVEPATDEDVVDESEEAESQDSSDPQTRVRLFTLHLSDRAPIGEDTKVYMQVGDEPAVGTIMKYAADKFKPDMKQWRDMSVSTANVTGATKVELSTSEGDFTLVKNDGAWSFEGDGSVAEDSVVAALLDSIQTLTAVAFIDGEPGDLAQFGLDEPRAHIRLTIPGVEEAERLAVGGFTDPNTKRLVYLRRNEVASIAKIRAADADELAKLRRTYQDRTILDIPATRIDRIEVLRDDHCTGTPTTLVYESGDDGWSMTAPRAAPIREDQFRSLIEAIGRLRAESIVSRSDQSVAGSLETPVARITIQHRAAARDETDSAVREEGPPPPQKNEDRQVTIGLSLASHGNRYFAKRGDDATLYEVSEEFLDKIFAEYRTGEVLAFDASEVVAFTIRNKDLTHRFARDGETWSYQSEPDLPLDSKKVDNLLFQFKDLSTERFVGYGEKDLQRFGLAQPAHEVTIMLDDGTKHTLQVSSKTCTQYPQDGLYSRVSDREEFFLLTADTVDRITVTLNELERKP